MRGDDRGFALVLVLIIAALLALVGAAFSWSIRSHVRLTANISQNARAEALADGGVALAILDLLAAREDRTWRARWPADGVARPCAAPDGGLLAITVSDEAGKVDLNTAPEPLLAALMAGLGTEPGLARRLAAAIADFRDRDDDVREGGAERAQYVAAGRALGPKNAPFEAVEELGQVLGMTPELATAARPHVTVSSGLAGVDASAASLERIRLLAAGGRAMGLTISGGASAAATLPQPFGAASVRRSFAISADAVVPGGSRFVREAVVELTGARDSHVVRSWSRNRDVPEATAPQGAPSPCG